MRDVFAYFLEISAPFEIIKYYLSYLESISIKEGNIDRELLTIVETVLAQLMHSDEEEDLKAYIDELNHEIYGNFADSFGGLISEIRQSMLKVITLFHWLF